MPRSLSLPAWVVVGSLAGIVTGIVFGERASVLVPIGSAYAMMLQIAIYPYLICSLLLGLGRLSPEMSRRFLGATWPAHLLVWILTFGTIWLLSQAIPLPPSPAQIDYWIDGKPRVVSKPRWNLWDAVAGRIQERTADAHE
jgi:Na+/H+-dicarboxylate symporter